MSDSLLTAALRRLLDETCTLEAAQNAERERWAPEVWNALAEGGFPWVSVPAEAGGSGGELADALEVLRLVGYYGAPVPVAETIISGRLLAAAGLTVPENAALTVVPGTAADTLSCVADGTGLRVQGAAHRVPWAAEVQHIVITAAHEAGVLVAMVDPSDVAVERHLSLAGEPRDTVVFGVTVAAGQFGVAVGLDPDAPALLGALARATMMAGALQRISDISVHYTSERHQFGRPVRSFQAVQEHLVHAAQEAALVHVSSAAAGLAAANGGGWFEITAAKLIANRAARIATAAAHQAHGAIGCTQEYPLHLFTRRLWSWQHECGSDAELSRRLGTAAVAAGADRQYSLITSGSSG
jgi:acyl-CoA dehydrogenase